MPGEQDSAVTATESPPPRASSPGSPHTRSKSASLASPNPESELAETPPPSGDAESPSSPPPPQSQPSASNSPSSVAPIAAANRKRGPADFDFEVTLGEGSYSTVVRARDRETGRHYAVKVLDKRHIVKEKKVKYVNIEKSVLHMTRHPFIVRLYYTFQDAQSLYFVLELAERGELLSYIRRAGTFDLAAARFYLAEMVVAIEYLHSKGVLHRDLKPENILLDKRMHIKLADFGTAKILSDKSQPPPPVPATPPPTSSGSNIESIDRTPSSVRTKSFVGTAEYVSPELLKDDNLPPVPASDVWALGCILYQMIAGKPPFKGPNDYQTFQKIIKLDYTFPDNFPDQARDLVTKILCTDPTQRIPIEEIKKHPFFEGFDWNDLWKQTPPELPEPPAGADSDSDIGVILPHFASSISNITKPMVEGGAISGSSLEYDPDILKFMPMGESGSGSTPSLSIGSQPSLVSFSPIGPGTGRSSTASTSEKSTPTVLTARTSCPKSNSTSRAQLRSQTPPLSGTSAAILSTAVSSVSAAIDPQRTAKLLQQAGLPWHSFLSGTELILRMGFVFKRKGLFSKKRYLILTDAPRLLYIDADKMELKGEIPMGPRTIPELKPDGKHFFVHTPGRTYYLEDTSGEAKQWVDAINAARPKPGMATRGVSQYIDQAAATLAEINDSDSSPGSASNDGVSSRLAETKLA